MARHYIQRTIKWCTIKWCTFIHSAPLLRIQRTMKREVQATADTLREEHLSCPSSSELVTCSEAGEVVGLNLTETQGPWPEKIWDLPL